MSKYTTEVRFICESSAGLTESAGGSNVDEIIQQAIPKVFDFTFPIFDEAYRNVLCGKILKHYYTREIGLETVGLWKLHLNRKLNEIMPYYNKLYESELLEFNPMYDFEYTKERTGTKKGNFNGQTDNTDNSTSSGNYLDAYSDTPQGAVENLESYQYLTNARKNVGTGTTQNVGNTVTSNTVNDTEEYLEHVSGKQGGQSYAKMLKEYRATFLNIDMSIINELSDLFMNIWT